MATREPIGRRYGSSSLPDDLDVMATHPYDFAEGQTDPRGFELWSRDDERVGIIRDLVGSPSAARGYFVLVDPMGMSGTRQFVIPLEILSLDAEERRAYGPFTRAEFMEGPIYQPGSRDFGRYYEHWSRFGSRAGTTTAQNATAAGEIRVPITEEQAQIRKEQREIGHVVLRKRVETETQHISEPVTRTRVEVERHAVPADQQREYAANVANATTMQEGEVMRIPVTEERLIVEKVPRVTEEVILRKETQTRQAEQDVELRREQVEVEEDEDVDVDVPARTSPQTRR